MNFKKLCLKAMLEKEGIKFGINDIIDLDKFQCKI
jgi:hypothetical protein